jgi:hypothetical protein
MLYDILFSLKQANTEKEKEKLYKQLEKLGMDRITINTLLKEI